MCWGYCGSRVEWLVVTYRLEPSFWPCFCGDSGGWSREPRQLPILILINNQHGAAAYVTYPFHTAKVCMPTANSYTLLFQTVESCSTWYVTEIRHIDMAFLQISNRYLDVPILELLALEMDGWLPVTDAGWRIDHSHVGRKRRGRRLALVLAMDGLIRWCKAREVSEHGWWCMRVRSSQQNRDRMRDDCLLNGK